MTVLKHAKKGDRFPLKSGAEFEVNSHTDIMVNGDRLHAVWGFIHIPEGVEIPGSAIGVSIGPAKIQATFRENGEYRSGFGGLLDQVIAPLN